MFSYIPWRSKASVMVVKGTNYMQRVSRVSRICGVYLRVAFISLVVYVGCGIYSRVALIE